MSSASDFWGKSGGGAIYPPIAVIDGLTTTPLAGSEFEGFIDEKSIHIDDGMVIDSPFTDYTLTGVGTVSVSSEFSTSYRGWECLNKTSNGEGDSWVTQDGVPSGWLKLVFDNPVQLDRFLLHSRDADTWSADFPKDFSFKYSSTTDTPDTTAKSWTNQSSSGRGLFDVFLLDSAITAKSLLLDVTSSVGGNYMGISQFNTYYGAPSIKLGTKFTTTKEAVSMLHEVTSDIPLPDVSSMANGLYTVWIDKDNTVSLDSELKLTKTTTGFYYNIANGNLYEDNVIVEKCPLGQVTISGGAITDVNSFYHGTKATAPINNGNTITVSTRYEDPLPFFGVEQLGYVKLYAEGKWGYSGQYTSANGVNARIQDNKFLVSGFKDSLHYANSGTVDGSDFTGLITTAKSLITIKRGY